MSDPKHDPQQIVQLAAEHPRRARLAAEARAEAASAAAAVAHASAALERARAHAQEAERAEGDAAEALARLPKHVRKELTDAYAALDAAAQRRAELTAAVETASDEAVACVDDWHSEWGKAFDALPKANRVFVRHAVRAAGVSREAEQAAADALANDQGPEGQERSP